jgi:hypothetical protein
VPFILSTDVKLHPHRIDIVWSEQKQIGLIDSLFRNYYIPPIIFGEIPVFLFSSQPAQIFSKAVSTSEDGSESRVCIDGKQRLTSIQKCVLHKIRLPHLSLTRFKVLGWPCECYRLQPHLQNPVSKPGSIGKGDTGLAKSTDGRWQWDLVPPSLPAVVFAFPVYPCKLSAWV